MSGKLAARRDQVKTAQYQAWLTARLIGFSKVPEFERLFEARAAAQQPVVQMAWAKTFSAMGMGSFKPNE